MKFNAIKAEIEKLSGPQQSALAEWLQTREEAVWDEQIRTDHKAGKLDELIRRAEKELGGGTIREAP